MVETKQCPICKDSNLAPFIKAKDHTVTGETFSIVECKTCGLKITSPRPADGELGKYYKSEKYISHSNSRSGLTNKLYHLARNYSLVKKLSLILSYKKPGSLLDIGCGTGEFLKFCQTNKWAVRGIEPNDDARTFATNQNKVQVGPEQELENIPNNSFDVITMWHVLEHVPDINKRVEQLRGLLKEDGVVFIAVPNPDSWDARKYKEKWAAYDVPRHLYHFNQKAIKRLFENQGFRLDKTKPMVLDALYVSMLSESYKNSSMGFLRGILNGILSNIKSNQAGFSSQIYIFKLK
jgi:2-polyprenyl-3-methyl-5-hydroxy-6-metoxy-1,4-benzoquinol methylase